MNSHFTWIDLSTFDVGAAKKFYRNVFDWDFIPDSSGYISCSSQETPSAGLYVMPEFLQKIHMPSFWMTYIAVEDVKAIATKARELGGKIELEEQKDWGKIVLIRDPAGAGFTCYQGDALKTERDLSSHGRWGWSELFVSDISLVRSFYTSLFDWSIENETDDRYAIFNKEKEKIASIQIAPNEIKGEKEFWAVYFTIRDQKAAKISIEQAGGRVIDGHKNTDGKHLLAYDNQGAAFLITESKQQKPKAIGLPHSYKAQPKLKWRSLIGLIMIYLIILFEQNWAWGALFLFWVIPDLKSGTTYFIEPLSRRSNPFLYWTVVLTWLLLAIYLLMDAVF